MDRAAVDTFEKLVAQLNSLRVELTMLAKKSPKDAVNEDHQDRNNQGNSAIEILFHCPILCSGVEFRRLLRVRRTLLCSHRRDCVFGNFQFQTVGSHPDDNHIVLDGKDNAADAARGGYPISCFDAGEHLLPLLLALLLRANHHQVKHRD